MKKWTLFLLPITFSFALIWGACDSGSSDEGTPELSVDPGLLNLTKDANSGAIRISNEGSGDLDWEIASKPEWLTLSKTSGSVRVGSDAITATADIDREDGSYTGTVSVTSNGGDYGLPVALDLSTWVRKADMPEPRMDAEAIHIAGKIYVIGGGNGQSLLEHVLEYDVNADSWSERAEIPTPRFAHCAAVVDGLIYVIGGDPGGRAPTALPTEVYDPATDTWTERSTLPDPAIRGAHSCEAVDGKIYAMGGTIPTANPPDYQPLRFVDEYDPATDTWERKEGLPVARWALATAEVDGTIYALGGHNVAAVADAAIAASEAYDCSSDTWAQISNMPTRRTTHRAIAVNGLVYVIGGGPSFDYLTVNEAYDPVTDLWAPKTGMPEPRGEYAIAAVDGRIYVIGGVTTHIGGPALKTVFEYTPAQ